MNDVLIHGLRRLADYNPALGEPERELLRNAASAIHGTDFALDAALPNLSTLDSLLTICSDPKKFQKELADLRALVKAAKDERAALAKEAADFDAKRERFEPDLKAKKGEHDRVLAADRRAYEEEREKRERDLVGRESKIVELEKTVQANAKAVEQMKVELQRRLDAIRVAAV